MRRYTLMEAAAPKMVKTTSFTPLSPQRIPYARDVILDDATRMQRNRLLGRGRLCHAWPEIATGRKPVFGTPHPPDWMPAARLASATQYWCAPLAPNIIVHFTGKRGGRSFEQVADIDKANRAQQFIVPCARFGHLHPDGKASWPSVGTPKCDFRLRVEWFRFVWGGEGFHLCKVVNHSPKRSLHHARILPCATIVHSPTNRHQGQPMPL